jgi:hypothetical protein
MDGQTQSGNPDFFVIKYDASGVKQWTRQMGVVGAAAGSKGISVDSSGNVYVSGDVNGPLDGVALTGTTDTFVVKFSSAGVKQWTRLIGGAGAFTPEGKVQIDRQGNIYVAAATNRGLYGETLTGSQDIFIVKFDPNGSRLWSRQIGAAGAFALVNGLNVDNSGNATVTGFINGGLDGNVRVGTSDAFVVKYDASGNKQWTRQFGGSGGVARGYAVSNDQQGNVFVFGFANVGLDGKPKIGINDGFIAKFDANGVKK